MKRKKGYEPNWVTVERLMAKSFNGGGLNEQEQQTVEAAFNYDCEEYSKRSQLVRTAIQERIRKHGA